jgi:hypothetical protein
MKYIKTIARFFIAAGIFFLFLNTFQILHNNYFDFLLFISSFITMLCGVILLIIEKIEANK